MPNRQIEPGSPWCGLVFCIEGGKLCRRIRDLGTMVYRHSDTRFWEGLCGKKTLRSCVQLITTRKKALQFGSESTTSIRNWSNLGRNGKNVTPSIDQL